MKTLTLSQNIIDILENNGFYVEHIEEQDGEFFIEISQDTPQGEDWWETIWFDDTDKGFIEAITTRAYNFDIDEEIEPYIECRGTHGIPYSIKALVEDAEWKRSTLEALVEELNEKGATNL